MPPSTRYSTSQQWDPHDTAPTDLISRTEYNEKREPAHHLEKVKMTNAVELDDLDTQPDDDEISVRALPADASDREIEKYFERGRLRVVQERNDFFLPHVLDFIEGRSWGNLQPEYQRRLRWDNTKKSRLIESFIMNVPVPPIFLYESELGRFEVMDGQQRLNAVVDFFSNRFKLAKLRTWPALNGRRFSELPPRIRRGLERAKISAITLMSDTGELSENSIDLRAQVFERLNTGGEQLNPQELRNSLYAGSFNQLLIDLSKDPLFTKAWKIPNHKKNTLSDGSPSEILRRNNLFKRMTDVEIVLRFFAFKEPERISGSVRSMLDSTMVRYRNSDEHKISELKASFRGAIKLSTTVFGDDVFVIPKGEHAPRARLSRPFFDAQMVVMHQMADRRKAIVRHAAVVKENVLGLADPESDSYELIVGRANTAVAVRSRIEAVAEAVNEVLK